MNFKFNTLMLIAVLAIMPTALSAVCPAGYNYYVNKTLTERSGVALPNHAVEFTMDTATLISGGKMNASACGVYIKGVDGTALPSWIVDGTCNKAATRIFTKIPRFTAGGSYKINVCYGNLTAPVYPNDMNRIFAYGDNFNSGTVINTSTWGRFCFDSGTVSTNIINGTVNITSRYEDSDYCGYRLANANLPNYYSEIKFKPVASGSDEVKMRISTSAADSGSWIRDRYDANAVEVDGGTTLHTQAGNRTSSNSTTGIGAVWQRAVFMGNTSGSVDKAETRVYNDGTNALLNRVKATLAAGGAGSAFGYIALWRAASAPSEMKKPNGFYDYAFSRNFTGSLDTEPNVSYSSGELPSSDPCALNPTGNTALATSAVCSGDLGSTTGNITINDGVAVEFRGAQMLFVGTNHTMFVKGSVIFNRTRVDKASTGRTKWFAVSAASADAPMRIYKSYFNATRYVALTKDYAIVDGAYFNQSTRSIGGIFGIYANRSIKNIMIRNVTFEKGHVLTAAMFSRNYTISGMSIIGDADDTKQTQISAGAYLYSSNRTYVSNVVLKNALGVAGMPYAWKNITEFGKIENVSGTVRGISGFTNFVYVLPIYLASTNYPSNTVLAARNYYFHNFNVSRNMTHSPSSNILAFATSYDGAVKNFTFEDMAFYDMYYSSSGMKMPYLLRTNATKTAAGGDEFVLINVTAYNSTTGNLNIPYFTVQTATVRTRFANYWYFQPTITYSNATAVDGATITLANPRFGSKSFTTQANGVPYGTSDNLFLGVRVNGTAVTRFKYNITVEKEGYITNSSYDVILNNSNWNQLSLLLNPVPIPIPTGYVPQFGVAGIAGGAIDLIAGSLVGLANVSFDIGSAFGAVIVLIIGAGVVLLAIAAIITLFKGIKGR